MPKVSICIPAFENEVGIRRLLNSIKLQSFKDYEIVLTDDSITDEVEKLVKDFPDVKYFRNEIKLGAPANWNEAIDKSTGDYIKIMHHDDYFTAADSLKKFVDLLELNPKAAFVFSGTAQVSDNEEYTRFTTDEDLLLIRRNYKNLFLGNTIGGPSVCMYRRNAFRYDVNLKWLVDMDFYMQMLRDNPNFAETNEPLITVGMSENQLTNYCIDNNDLKVKEYSYVYKKYELQDKEEYRKKLTEILGECKADYDTYLYNELTQKEYNAEIRRRKKETIVWILTHQFAELVFFLGVWIELLIVILDKSNYTNPIEGQLFRVTFLLFGVKILLTRLSKKEWLYLVLLSILGYISYRYTGRNEVLRLVVFVFACQGIKADKILKTMWLLTTIGCGVLVLLSVSGVYGTLALTTDFGRGISQTRYCLGLGHPNALHCMFFMIVTVGIYIYHEKIKLPGYLVIGALNIGLFYLTDSRTGFLVTTLVIVGAAILRIFPSLNEKIWPYLLTSLAIIACVSLSVLVANPDYVSLNKEASVFQNEQLYQIDRLLNGRIKDLYFGSSHAEGTTTTWSLFSDRDNIYYFDMGYVRLF